MTRKKYINVAKLRACCEAGCKAVEMEHYFGLSRENLRTRMRELGIELQRKSGGTYAPKPHDVLHADKVQLIRERDMLRIEVEILRKERRKLIEEGKL